MTRRRYKTTNVVVRKIKPKKRKSKRIDGRKTHHDGRGQSGRPPRRR